jgi:L,D-transpeptidase-like protein
VASRVRQSLRLAGLATGVALALAIPATVAAAPPAAADAPASASADPYRLSASEAYLAQVVVPTVARARPGSGRAVMRVPTLAEWGGGPVRLLVLRSLLHDGRRWLAVRLPERPNASLGWIRADVTRIVSTPWRLTISTGRATVTVSRSGREVHRFRAVVGKPSTPTPRGLFAIDERIRQPAGSELGPWALFLTAHSRVLRNYGGGPGRVAIHGRAGPLLASPLGSAASHGCIRVENSWIRWLSRIAIEGTPVQVVR